MMLNQAVIEFIDKTLIADKTGSRITESTRLIEEGIIDSMGLMQIIAFLEERTGIRVPDDEVTPDNFQSVLSIASMVTRLEQGGRDCPGAVTR